MKDNGPDPMKRYEVLDQDDAPKEVPVADTDTVTRLCKITEGKSFLTMEGYANSVPGFSQYIKSVAESGDVGKLLKVIKSYVRFESIVRGNYKKGQEGFVRFDRSLMNRRTVVTPEPPRFFMEALNRMIIHIAKAYEDPRLIKAVKLIFSRGWVIRKTRMQAAIESFDEIFDSVMKRDGGKKLLEIVGATELKGITLN